MERAVIIVAGGSGVRMGGAVPKQFMPLGAEGKPVLVHTVERMLGAAARVVLVVPSCEAARWEEIAQRWGVRERIEVCAGGATRFESVRNAVEHIDDMPGDTLVAIHDGVRPLVGRETIEQGFALAAMHGSAVPYTAPVDSFRIDGAPVDRTKLMAIQTPQVFRLDLLARAYRRATVGDFTDDASVVEAAGGTLRFFEGDRWNIKITSPVDMIIAKALLAAADNRA